MGFPTAEVTIFDTGSPEPYAGRLRALAVEAGAAYVNTGKKITHGAMIRAVILGFAEEGRRTPIVLLHSDVELQEKWEDRTPPTLYWGLHCAARRLASGFMEERVHPCFLWVRDPVEAWEKAERYHRRFMFDNIFEMTVVGNGDAGIVLWDNMAAVHSLYPEDFSFFPEEGFLHMFAGTYPDKIGQLGLLGETEKLIRERHEEMGAA